MKSFLKYISFFLIYSCVGNDIFAQADTSTVILSPESFMEIVRKNHPIARQASIQVDKGRSSVLKARGGFDPKLKAGNYSKDFEGQQYFNIFNGTLSLPTLYGLELKTGYDFSRGKYLNPENSLPESGLLFAGVSLTLGQGLMIDERRAVLQQAKIYNKSTAAEQSLMLNDLIFNAGKEYWEWFAAYYSYETFKSAVEVSSQRFFQIKESALLGDRPFIDTIEAGIQLQERQLSMQQAEIDLVNRGLRLSVYLWDENSQPLTLTSLTRPIGFEDGVNKGQLTLLLDSTVWGMHPELQLYAFKLDQLKIENKWKREQLKPTLNISYNPLFSTGSTVSTVQFYDNFKLGLNFSMPLFLRKERGDLQLTGFKMRETELDIKYKSRETFNRTQMMVNEYMLSLSQLDFYTNTVRDYQTLLDAEKSMFDGGESSLFMINAREMGYISARLKLIDLMVKNRKARLGAYHAAGQLGL